MKATVGGYTRIEEITETRTKVICIWGPGDTSVLHDHSAKDGGKFHGVVTVLKGTLFQIDEYGNITLHEAGSRFLEISAGAGHVVGNCGHTVAVSVHTYEPSLAMRTFPYTKEILAAFAELDMELEPVPAA